VIIGDRHFAVPRRAADGIKSRVEQVVRFLGFVPSDTLRCFYESGGGLRVPLALRRFGLPPLEAMACGTPVVTSNVSSLPEVGRRDAAVLVKSRKRLDIRAASRKRCWMKLCAPTLIPPRRAQACKISWKRPPASARDLQRSGGRRRLTAHETTVATFP